MKTRSPPTGWARQNAAPLKFDPQPSEAAFLATFRTVKLENCRPEVSGDVISGVSVDNVDKDVHVNFCDSTTRTGQIITLLAGQIHYMHFCAVFNVFFRGPEAGSDVISDRFGRPIVTNTCVK